MGKGEQGSGIGCSLPMFPVLDGADGYANNSSQLGLREAARLTQSLQMALLVGWGSGSGIFHGRVPH